MGLEHFGFGVCGPDLIGNRTDIVEIFGFDPIFVFRLDTRRKSFGDTIIKNANQEDFGLEPLVEFAKQALGVAFLIRPEMGLISPHKMHNYRAHRTDRLATFLAMSNRQLFMETEFNVQ
jgi:hypothetical protein